jgi:predicted GIY-YIG superfamily endonuclease
MTTAHFLYRHYDKDDNLLYVGITNDLTRRTRQHRAYSRWIKLSVSITNTSFDDRDDCYSAEERAIKNENPIFNIAFNNNYPARELGFRKNRAIALALLMPNTDFLYHIYTQGILDYRQSENATYVNFCFHIIETFNITDAEYKRAVKWKLEQQKRLGYKLKIPGLFKAMFMDQEHQQPVDSINPIRQVTTHEVSLVDKNSELIEALRAQIELLKDQVSQEREHSAHWRNQATMLLTHQPEPSKPQDSRLWLKLFGRR